MYCVRVCTYIRLRVRTFTDLLPRKNMHCVLFSFSPNGIKSSFNRSSHAISILSLSLECQTAGKCGPGAKYGFPLAYITIAHGDQSLLNSNSLSRFYSLSTRATKPIIFVFCLILSIASTVNARRQHIGVVLFHINYLFPPFFVVVFLIFLS